MPPRKKGPTYVPPEEHLLHETCSNANTSEKQSTALQKAGKMRKELDCKGNC